MQLWLSATNVSGWKVISMSMNTVLKRNKIWIRAIGSKVLHSSRKKRKRSPVISKTFPSRKLIMKRLRNILKGWAIQMKSNIKKWLNFNHAVREYQQKELIPSLSLIVTYRMVRYCVITACRNHSRPFIISYNSKMTQINGYQRSTYRILIIFQKTKGS